MGKTIKKTGLKKSNYEEHQFFNYKIQIILCLQPKIVKIKWNQIKKFFQGQFVAGGILGRIKAKSDSITQIFKKCFFHRDFRKFFGWNKYFKAFFYWLRQNIRSTDESLGEDLLKLFQIYPKMLKKKPILGILRIAFNCFTWFLNISLL